MEQIDKLFNEKLGQYERPVSTAAWDKLATGLQNKKQRGFYFYMRIAAGFTLIAVAAAYLIFKNDGTESQTETMAIAEVEVPNDSNEKSITEIEEQTTTPELKEEIKAPVHHTNPTKEKNAVAYQAPNKIEKPITEKEIVPLVQPEEIVNTELAQLSIDMSNNTTQEVAEVINTKPISLNIILSGKATESNALASNQYQEDEKEGLGGKMKKLLGKAQELKYSEGALADLRQAKDEILAFDFKKESLK